jgi:hypothetical protein
MRQLDTPLRCVIRRARLPRAALMSPTCRLVHVRRLSLDADRGRSRRRGRAAATPSRARGRRGGAGDGGSRWCVAAATLLGLTLASLAPTRTTAYTATSGYQQKGGILRQTSPFRARLADGNWSRNEGSYVSSRKILPPPEEEVRRHPFRSAAAGLAARRKMPRPHMHAFRTGCSRPDDARVVRRSVARAWPVRSCMYCFVWVERNV